jgi:hypothetical protein
MDEKRFHELQVKAGTRGLSDLEAEELGRMYAELEGKPYSHWVPKPAGSSATTRAPRATTRVRRGRFGLLRLRGPRSLEIGQTATIEEGMTGEKVDREKPAA